MIFKLKQNYWNSSVYTSRGNKESQCWVFLKRKVLHFYALPEHMTPLYTPAAKDSYLSLIPMIHMGGGTGAAFTRCPLTSMHTHSAVCARPHSHTGTQSELIEYIPIKGGQCCVWLACCSGHVAAPTPSWGLLLLVQSSCSPKQP